MTVPQPGAPAIKTTGPPNFAAMSVQQMQEWVGESLQRSETEMAEMRQVIATMAAAAPAGSQVETIKAILGSGAFRAQAAAPVDYPLLGGAIRSMAMSYKSRNEGDYKTPVQMAAQLYGESHAITTSVGYKAAISTDSGAAGGFPLGPAVVARVFEGLRAKPVLDRAGIATLDSPGVLELVTLEGGVTPQWRGETTARAVGQQTWGLVQSRLRTLDLIVPISETWFRRQTGNQDGIIERDTLNTMAVALDNAMLRSAGSEFTPRGLLHWCHPDHKSAATALAGTDPLVDAQSVINQIIAMIGQIEDAYIPSERRAFIGPTRTRRKLMGMLGPQGQRMFPNVRTEVEGEPAVWAQAAILPVTLGGGTESEHYFIAPEEIFKAMGENLSVRISTEGTIVNGGTTVSAIQHGVLFMIFNLEADLVPRTRKAISVRTGVTWGA